MNTSVTRLTHSALSTPNSPNAVCKNFLEYFRKHSLPSEHLKPIFYVALAVSAVLFCLHFLRSRKQQAREGIRVAVPKIEDFDYAGHIQKLPTLERGQVALVDVSNFRCPTTKNMLDLVERLFGQSLEAGSGLNLGHVGYGDSYPADLGLAVRLAYNRAFDEVPKHLKADEVMNSFHQIKKTIFAGYEGVKTLLTRFPKLTLHFSPYSKENFEIMLKDMTKLQKEFPEADLRLNPIGRADIDAETRPEERDVVFKDTRGNCFTTSRLMLAAFGVTEKDFVGLPKEPIPDYPGAQRHVVMVRPETTFGFNLTLSNLNFSNPIGEDELKEMGKIHPWFTRPYQHDFLNSLMQKGDFTDFTLVTGDHRVRVHKVLMRMMSPYIRYALERRNPNANEIRLNGFSQNSLEGIVNFIYSNDENFLPDRISPLAYEDPYFFPTATFVLNKQIHKSLFAIQRTREGLFL